MEQLAAGGLGTLLVSIDSHSLRLHERNRGLRGLRDRIRRGHAIARRLQIRTFASVTVSRLLNYDALPRIIEKLGFDAVIFSYPRREPFESSSLVYGENSSLIDFQPAELILALDRSRR
jgi:MoaA/NifB/PqqE/SkfB family radical SAM enzyme